MKTYDCWVTVFVGQIEAESREVAEEWAAEELRDAVAHKETLDATIDAKEVEP